MTDKVDHAAMRRTELGAENTELRLFLDAEIENVKKIIDDLPPSAQQWCRDFIRRAEKVLKRCDHFFVESSTPTSLAKRVCNKCGQLEWLIDECKQCNGTGTLSSDGMTACGCTVPGAEAAR